LGTKPERTRKGLELSQEVQLKLKASLTK